MTFKKEKKSNFQYFPFNKHFLSSFQTKTNFNFNFLTHLQGLHSKVGMSPKPGVLTVPGT